MQTEGMEEGPSWQGDQLEVSLRGNKPAGHDAGGGGVGGPPWEMDVCKMGCGAVESLSRGLYAQRGG